MSEQILQHENIVFSIVQDYLHKNRVFTIGDAVPFINVRLKQHSISLTYMGIKEVLKSLIKKKLILEKSKLSKDNLLNNETRKMIFKYICDNPGVYFNQIAKKLNLSNYILAWHVKMLKNFNFIRSKDIENHEVFFDFILKPEYDLTYYLIAKDKSREILNYLIKNKKGASKTKLSNELKMHSNTVKKYVESLEAEELLYKEEMPRKTIYRLNHKKYYSYIRK